MIHLGTSGYSFQDWVGPFYPEGTKREQMLEYYQRHFGTVEINSTYYRLPAVRTMERMAERTGPEFRFLVKFHGDVTHRRTSDPAAFDAFLRVLGPLERSGKFHGALAQFPWSFRPSSENKDYLKFVRRVYGDRPLFFEFRHESWAARETFELLGELKAGFCAVDEPRLPGLFPPIVRATGEVGYVRFHGRNSNDWWGGDSSGRYNYLYSDEELKGWVDAIRKLDARSKDTFVFFNNCHAGRAVQNAKRMGELLQLW